MIEVCKWWIKSRKIAQIGVKLGFGQILIRIQSDHGDITNITTIVSCRVQGCSNRNWREIMAKGRIILGYHVGVGRSPDSDEILMGYTIWFGLKNDWRSEHHSLNFNHGHSNPPISRQYHIVKLVVFPYEIPAQSTIELYNQLLY